MNLKKINRYVVYILSIFIITLGSAISIKANLGSSPVICVPYVSSLIANTSVGFANFIINIIFVLFQIILLRGAFKKIQLLQLVIGTLFSVFVDFSMILVSFINPTTYLSQLFFILLSSFVIGFGVFLEVRTEVVFLPPDGVVVAIAKVLNKEFAKIKPFFDTTMIIIAIILSFAFLGHLTGVREGTVIAAIIIGPIVKILQKYLNKYVDLIIEK